MTHLIHGGSGRRVRLGPLTTVGRAPVCDLSPGADAVSRFHALVFWSEGDGHVGWAVRDLHSRNGTFVDGRAIHPGRDVALFDGSAVAFGRPEAVWTLADADRPPMMLVGRREDHDVRLVGRTLLLPHPEPIAAMVHHERGSGWVLETDEAVRPLAGDRPFFAADGEWRAVLPRALDETRALPSGLALVFEFPPGDDVVDLWVEQEGARSRVMGGGTERMRFLLTLARKRAEEAAAQVPEVNQGWMHVDELMEALECNSPQTLNQWVVRLRTAFSSVVRADFDLIERRNRTGYLRLGHGNLRVVMLER